MKTSQSLFSNYNLVNGVLDEFFDRKGNPHFHLIDIIDKFARFTHEKFVDLHQRAQELLTQRGVTFNVYSNQKGVEKIFPFDLFPRIISAREWTILEKGLKQRIQAINAFLKDVYNEQYILKDRRIPPEVIFSSKGYNFQMRGIVPPAEVYVHVAGIDLIQVSKDQFVVLEDNLKVPSGVSYAIENRNIMMLLLPDIFREIAIMSIDDYPLQLRDALLSLIEENVDNPLIVLLTPGSYNSAYFEHAFLARRMGCPLVINSDLVVEDDKVYLKTLRGLKRVHVIYRRTDESYLDPMVFDSQSVLGIPGVVKAYVQGNVILANALGNGVADDKGIYPYVPEMIRYYLREEPILPQVKTYSCADPKDLEFILANLASLVIKIVNKSGGEDILIGPQATKEQLKEAGERILANPRDYIAQQLQELSCCPTLIEGSRIEPRRIDFRPYIVTGKTTLVLPGGLTRVALREHSYIVNSCQGGGSKDTWILS